MCPPLPLSRPTHNNTTADTLIITSFLNNVAGTFVIGLMVTMFAHLPKDGASFVLYTGGWVCFC